MTNDRQHLYDQISQHDNLAEITVEGQLVFYDRDNTDAWIQSSYSIKIGQEK